MTHSKLLATLLFIAALLSGGCTSMDNKPSGTYEQRMAALAPWAARGELLMIEVPAAPNPLSNQLMIATLKTGSSSNTADQIVTTLRNGRAVTLAVVGNSLAVNAATVQSALKTWASTGARTATTLLLVGEPEDAAALKEAAVAAGVRLEIAKIPEPTRP
ncbi:hypothetical protein RD110_17585 [Rhodoferax koreense]|uniref:Uncharacterized protein n=1 Tax=Rhodoferax koreensis TaxID=1842727 RepID=A0A1P8JYH5_9BURK|nr:hypothetical protein [Rhodoferax koreense]APW38795.1 hypothetical protein RD110_17585 [Rhodoferax koreense]